MDTIPSKPNKWKLPIIFVSIIAFLSVAFVSYKIYDNKQEAKAIEQKAKAVEEQRKRIIEESLKDLKKIDAATQVGITKTEYSKMLITAQASVNQTTEKLSEGKLKQEITLAMEAYKDAGTLSDIDASGSEIVVDPDKDDDCLWLKCSMVARDLAIKYEIPIKPTTYMKQAGRQPKGMDKNEGLSVIWSEARKHTNEASRLLNEKSS